MIARSRSPPKDKAIDLGRGRIAYWTIARRRRSTRDRAFFGAGTLYNRTARVPGQVVPMNIASTPTGISPLLPDAVLQEREVELSFERSRT